MRRLLGLLTAADTTGLRCIWWLDRRFFTDSVQSLLHMRQHQLDRLRASTPITVHISSH